MVADCAGWRCRVRMLSTMSTLEAPQLSGSAQAISTASSPSSLQELLRTAGRGRRVRSVCCRARRGSRQPLKDAARRLHRAFGSAPAQTRMSMISVKPKLSANSRGLSPSSLSRASTSAPAASRT